MTGPADRVEWARTLVSGIVVEATHGVRRERIDPLNTEARAVLMALCALPMRPAEGIWGGAVLFDLEKLAAGVGQSSIRAHKWLRVLEAARILRRLTRETNEIWRVVVDLPQALMPVAEGVENA